MKISNQGHLRKILMDQAEDIGKKNVRAYAEKCADMDPSFFRWLFNTSEWNDFHIPAEAREVYNQFLDTLPTE